jgi:hypothetical protein
VKSDRHPYRYFPAGDEMTHHFDTWVDRLHQSVAINMSGPEFATAIAEPWGEINIAHLFREGNTRTQVVFFTYFARTHGHSLDYDRFSRDPQFRLRFNAGRFLIQANEGPDLLADTLTEAIASPPTRRSGLPTARAIPPTVTPVDDYAPHYVSVTTRRPGGRCGAQTSKGTACRRRGRCPFHGR